MGDAVKDYDQREKHTALRLKQRYNLQLTADLKKEIVREILRAERQARQLKGRKERPAHRRPRPARATTTQSTNSRNRKWTVETSMGTIIAVFDHVDKIIVTVLPLPERGDLK